MSSSNLGLIKPSCNIILHLESNCDIGSFSESLVKEAGKLYTNPADKIFYVNAFVAHDDIYHGPETLLLGSPICIQHDLAYTSRSTYGLYVASGLYDGLDDDYEGRAMALSYYTLRDIDNVNDPKYSCISVFVPGEKIGLD